MNNKRTVVIVGRMNVGKSTLFNRLSTNVKSITLDYPGVTRDFISDMVTWNDQTFELIDTGGVSLKKSADQLTQAVALRALEIVQKADIILFVVDGTSGMTLEDQEIIKNLRKIGRPVMVVVNKIDSKSARERAHEFEKLGYAGVYEVSAQHGLGIGQLLDALVDQLRQMPAVKKAPEPAYKVVLLGKPNVGKSSLMNLLLKQERSLVSDVPGTTRESVTEPITFYQETISLVDTAGVRRKRAVTQDLEQLMVKSTLQAVREADIVLLLIDTPQGSIADQELKLAFHVFQEGKALILLFNKDDLATEESNEQLKMDLSKYRFFIKKVAQLSISCKTQKNIGKILPLVTQVWKRHSSEFKKDEITDLFKTALIYKELFHKGERLKIQRVKQIKRAPITLVLYVNEPQWFGASQLSFFENVLRKKYNLVGAPVKLVPRK